MPDGTVDSLTKTELVHLVRFLSELGKVGKFSVGKEQVVRRWQSLIFSPQANRRLNRTSFDTAAGDDPLLQWESRYSTVAGVLPLEELAKFKPHREVNPTALSERNYWSRQQALSGFLVRIPRAWLFGSMDALLNC